MEHKIIVVGIGPGNKDYILPIALKYIDETKVIVGGKRALNEFAKDEQIQIPITREIQVSLDKIKENIMDNDVVVMVSGDPGFYSLLPALKAAFPKTKIDVVPGISSMQLAFSRIGMPWQKADLISLHGRLPDYASLAYEKGRIVGMLTDDEHNSQRIAMLLLDAGWPENTKVYIAANLSYENEKIIETTLIRATAQEAIRQCIMVVLG